MEKWLYVMIIEKGKLYNKVTKAVIERHVANLKRLDDKGNLELGGAFKGYATYKLKALQVANRENNYLLY